jgi:hypothetical protein
VNGVFIGSSEGGVEVGKAKEEEGVCHFEDDDKFLKVSDKRHGGSFEGCGIILAGETRFL